ncbi:AraC family transcriptional regulator [Butyrivibrio sp. AD3002]|uniref:AraC family transcriptional regulator n=1 Tax=Butyrivibrio sp. AD3002 TaxID=1280670 RepID=UPI0003B4F8A1|nr:AraC family transcriptional regulator [Butyrivibrio sp. AD3002]
MKNKLRSSFNTRQYMLSSDFEVFYYSDRNFPTLSPHTHDYYEFYLFIEGDITMEIFTGKGESTLHRMSPGDLMIVPPGTSHHAIMNDSTQNYRRFVFWISKKCCESLTAESVDYMYLIQKAEAFHKYIYHLSPSEYHQVEHRFLRLLEEISAERYGSSTARHLCLCDLIITINRVIYEEEHAESKNDELSLFQNVLSYVENNLEESLSLDDIAGQFFVSKYYISHMFKDTLGISLHQYIIKKRLAECQSAITNGESISKTYERFGFRDYSSFFKAFKKEYGMSPKEYQTLYSHDHA